MDNVDLIITQALSGDQAAYTKLYNHFKRDVKMTLLTIVKDDDLAAELLQVTFIKAFERLDTYEPISFKFWLKTIATNVAIDHIRASKTGVSNVGLELDDPLDYRQLFSGEKNPEQQVIEKEDIVYMTMAFEKLRTDYRMVLELKYNQDLTYEEIAEIMGKPPGTIKSLLHKAKQRISSIFRELTN